MTLFMGLQKIAKPRVGTSSGKLFFPKQEEPKISQKISFNISSMTNYGIIQCNTYLDGELIDETPLEQPDNIIGDVLLSIPENCSLYQVEVDNGYDTISSMTISLPYLLEGNDITIDGWTGSCCVPNYSDISTPYGYVKAKNLQIGDIIYGWDFEENCIKETTIKFISYPTRVNIVHINLRNDTYVEITDNHVIWTDIGWAAYYPEKVLEVETCSNLSDAKYLYNDKNEKIEIESITYLDIPEGVVCVDFTTDTHTYYSNGFLVHNAKCPGGDNIINLYIFRQNYDPIQITTPLEKFYIKRGTSIGNNIANNEGKILRSFTWYNSETSTYDTLNSKIYIQNYILNDRIVDIQNDVFNSDTTISMLLNITTPVSFTDTVSYESEQRRTGGGTVDYYMYKGVYNSPVTIEAHKLHYNQTSWSDKYELYIPYLYKLSYNNLNADLYCNFYSNNNLYKTWTNAYSYTITASEYSRFPSSGTIKIVCGFNNPSNITINGYIWTATPNTGGAGWIWYCTNGK